MSSETKTNPIIDIIKSIRQAVEVAYEEDDDESANLHRILLDILADVEARCLDCGVDTQFLGDYYMLHDTVWHEINGEEIGMLCIQCAEKRLGRELQPSDFTDAPVNSPGAFYKSVLLQKRLGIW